MKNSLTHFGRDVVECKVRHTVVKITFVCVRKNPEFDSDNLKFMISNSPRKSRLIWPRFIAVYCLRASSGVKTALPMPKSFSRSGDCAKMKVQ